MAAVSSALVSAASPPRDSLVLLLMKGHPGSGKSTLARSLARSLRWPLVDKDVFRDATMLLERPDGPCATPVDARVLNSLSYDAMWQMAEVQLDLGLSVVVDCPLAHEALFKAGVALGTRVGAEVALIECHVSDLDTWKRRIQSRAAAALSDGRPSENVENCEGSCRPSVLSQPHAGSNRGNNESSGASAGTVSVSSDGASEMVPAAIRADGKEAIHRQTELVRRVSDSNDVSEHERRGEIKMESASESEKQQTVDRLKFTARMHTDSGRRGSKNDDVSVQERGGDSASESEKQQTADRLSFTERMHTDSGGGGCRDDDVSSQESGGDSASERGTRIESERGKAAGVSLKGRWHRPACWEDMQELLDRYNGCWTYPTGSVPKLMIDTGIVGPDEALAMALGWLQTALVLRRN